MGYSSDVEAVFNLRVDGKQGVAELVNFRAVVQKEVTGIAQDFAAGAGGIGTFTAALGPAGLALGAFLGVGAGVVSMMSEMIAKGVELGSKYHDLALSTGLSVETLSGLDSQLVQSGTSVDTLARGVLIMQKNLGTAARSGKDFGLGITDANSALKDTDGTLKTVLAHLGAIKDEGTRNSEGLRVFGKAWRELSVFVADTGGDIDSVMKKAQEAGEVMSTQVANNLDDLGDAWDRLKHQAAIAGGDIAGVVAPEITKAINDISEALTGNSTTWEQWGLGIAVAVARVRGVLEGAAKWAHRPLCEMSPEQFGKDIDQGAESAEIGAYVDYYANKYGPQQPKLKGGPGLSGGGRRDGSKDKTARLQERALQLEEKDFDEEFRRDSDALQEDYKRRLVSLEEYTEGEITLLERWIADKLAIYDREEEAAKKNIKNEQERDNKLHEIAQKRVAASDEYNRRRNQVEDDYDAKQKAATNARADALLAVDEAVGKQRIATIEHVAELGIKRESDAAKEVGDIQLQMHDRAVQRLKERLDQEEAGSAEYRRIQGEIATAEVERATLEEEVAHRVEVARKREIEAVRQLRAELAAAEIDITRMEIEAAARENKFPTRSERLTIIRAMAEAELAAEEERHKQALAALEHKRQEGADEAVINQAIEQEERRHLLAMGQIQQQQKDQEDATDPLGSLKDLWGKFKSDTENANDSISGSVKSMSDTVAGSILAMGSALKEGIKANLLYGDSLGKALKKALAEQLAEISAEATIQGLKHAAYALGSLAFGDFSGAAKHAAAAAAFFALAAATGKGASSLAKSAGMQGASAGTGSTAGSAVSSTQQQPQTIVQGRTGGSSNPNVIEVSRSQFQPAPIIIHLETVTKNEPGTLTEHIVKVVGQDGRVRDAVVNHFKRDFNENGTVRQIILEGAGA